MGRIQSGSFEQVLKDKYKIGFVVDKYIRNANCLGKDFAIPVSEHELIGIMASELVEEIDMLMCNSGTGYSVSDLTGDEMGDLGCGKTPYEALRKTVEALQW